MKVAIVGAGGVGGSFGAQLIRSGTDVAFVVRGAHRDAINEKGLTVTTAIGEILAMPRIATEDPGQIGPVDVVILAVKAGQVVGVAKSLSPLLGPDTYVVPLQNGVEAADQLAAVLGPSRVVTGLCGVMAWISGPGCIRVLGDVNFIRVGESDNRPSDRLQQLCDVLNSAGIDARIPPDIQVALWEKFLFVSSLGSVCAYHDLTFGPVRDTPESRSVLIDVMQEVANLGRRRGVALDDTVVDRAIAMVDELPVEGTTSMHRDIAGGRPSELEAWTGAVVRLGHMTGVDVPRNAEIYASLAERQRADGAVQIH